MTWILFSEELWDRLSDDPDENKAAHKWAVEQYKKLQDWNEELRGELEEARKLAETWRDYAKEYLRGSGAPLPWEKK